VRLANFDTTWMHRKVVTAQPASGLAAADILVAIEKPCGMSAVLIHK